MYRFFSCISFARIRLLLNLQSAGNIKLIYVLEKKKCFSRNRFIFSWQNKRLIAHVHRTGANPKDRDRKISCTNPESKSTLKYRRKWRKKPQRVYLLRDTQKCAETMNQKRLDPYTLYTTFWSHWFILPYEQRVWIWVWVWWR